MSCDEGDKRMRGWMATLLSQTIAPKGSLALQRAAGSDSSRVA